MHEDQIIQADWTWTGALFEEDVQVVVGPDGHIEHVGALDIKPTHKLRNRALLPGFVNAHSHAFQRGLRGRTETFPAGSSSFWSWREQMYALVNDLGADRFYELTRQAFAEMLRCGISTVGEFHYLHHDESGRGYALDQAVLSAAKDAGIRLVLLNAYYNTGGINRPPETAQTRFLSTDFDGYRRHMDALAADLDSATQSLGVVAHSIRAITLDDLTRLHRYARQHGRVFHMHLEEQAKEIEECVAAYSQSPLPLVCGRLEIDHAFTAVHCTHSTPDDLQRFIRAGGNVCICPLTEANLGDGVPDLPAMLSARARTCVGTDSNARICFTEELRWLEYLQRAMRQTRGVCLDDSGRNARALLTVGTENGAHALGLKAGRIEPGYAADFVALDLTCPSLSGWTADTLLDALIFGSGAEAVAATCVAGRWTKPPDSAHN